MMKGFSIIAMFVIASGVALGQTSFYAADGIAIKGYDPVAYFSEGKPVEGLKEFSYSWQGTEWHFKNLANRDAFKAAPEKYAPQFGGYCAYGASQNHKSPTDPVAFTIVNQRLYLNYSPKVKELWMKDTTGYIVKARKNWTSLKDQK